MLNCSWPQLLSGIEYKAQCDAEGVREFQPRAAPWLTIIIDGCYYA